MVQIFVHVIKLLRVMFWNTLRRHVLLTPYGSVAKWSKSELILCTARYYYRRICTRFSETVFRVVKCQLAEWLIDNDNIILYVHGLLYALCTTLYTVMWPTRVSNNVTLLCCLRQWVFARFEFRPGARQISADDRITWSQKMHFSRIQAKTVSPDGFRWKTIGTRADGTSNRNLGKYVTRL